MDHQILAGIAMKEGRVPIPVPKMFWLCSGARHEDLEDRERSLGASYCLKNDLRVLVPSVFRYEADEAIKPTVYIGTWGLRPVATNLSSFNNPIPSWISTLKDKSLIASLSWGYTAGSYSEFLGTSTSIFLRLILINHSEQTGSSKFNSWRLRRVSVSV